MTGGTHDVFLAGFLRLYGNRDYMRNYFDLGRIEAAVGKVYIWYARYNAELSEEEREAADIWQYTSGGRVPGVQGCFMMSPPFFLA